MMRNLIHIVYPLARVLPFSAILSLHQSFAQEGSASLKREIAVVPGRPSVADPAAISTEGVLEVEFGLSHAADRSGESDLTTPVVFKFSLSNRLQLRACSDGFATMTSGSQGWRLDFTNLSFGVQYVLFSQEQAGTDMGLRLESTILNDRNDLLNSNLTVLGLFSKDLGDPHIDVNLGYRYQKYEAVSRRSQVHAAAAIDGALSGQWRWAGEIRAIRSEDFRPLYGLAAVTYQPHPAVSWDAGVEFGLNHYAPRYTLFAGVVFILLQ